MPEADDVRREMLVRVSACLDILEAGKGGIQHLEPDEVSAFGSALHALDSLAATLVTQSRGGNKDD